MVMANLYAFRATQPRDLFRANDPIGPLNDDYLNALSGFDLIAGWGNHGHQPDRLVQVAHLRLQALAVNQSGAPAHPLYLKKNCLPRPYTIDQGKVSPMR